MTGRTRRSIGQATQRGAVLIVSLVMLLITTMLGVTAISSSRMGEKMAANAMNRNVTFQAAESAIENAVADTNNLLQAISAGDAGVNDTLDINSSDVAATSNTRYQGAGLAVGFSLAADSSGFSAYRFEITGTGAISALNAQTVSAQGISRIGPSN
ncbi:MAG: hypothetical protein GXP10_10460 [Gammaproteobacteria bacterium]|nr:hypothetical protein [Gammaproteobacteria bacterium]